MIRDSLCPQTYQILLDNLKSHFLRICNLPGHFDGHFPFDSRTHNMEVRPEMLSDLSRILPRKFTYRNYPGHLTEFSGTFSWTFPGIIPDISRVIDSRDSRHGISTKSVSGSSWNCSGRVYRNARGYLLGNSRDSRKCSRSPHGTFPDICRSSPSWSLCTYTSIANILLMIDKCIYHIFESVTDGNLQGQYSNI